MSSSSGHTPPGGSGSRPRTANPHRTRHVITPPSTAEIEAERIADEVAAAEDFGGHSNTPPAETEVIWRKGGYDALAAPPSQNLENGSGSGGRRGMPTTTTATTAPITVVMNDGEIYRAPAPSTTATGGGRGNSNPSSSSYSNNGRGASGQRPPSPGGNDAGDAAPAPATRPHTRNPHMSQLGSHHYHGSTGGGGGSANYGQQQSSASSSSAPPPPAVVGPYHQHEPFDGDYAVVATVQPLGGFASPAAAAADGGGSGGFASIVDDVHSNSSEKNNNRRSPQQQQQQFVLSADDDYQHSVLWSADSVDPEILARPHTSNPWMARRNTEPDMANMIEGCNVATTPQDQQRSPRASPVAAYAQQPGAPEVLWSERPADNDEESSQLLVRPSSSNPVYGAATNRDDVVVGEEDADLPVSPPTVRGGGGRSGQQQRSSSGDDDATRGSAGYHFPTSRGDDGCCSGSRGDDRPYPLPYTSNSSHHTNNAEILWSEQTEQSEKQIETLASIIDDQRVRIAQLEEENAALRVELAESRSSPPTERRHHHHHHGSKHHSNKHKRDSSIETHVHFSAVAGGAVAGVIESDDNTGQDTSDSPVYSPSRHRDGERPPTPPRRIGTPNYSRSSSSHSFNNNAARRSPPLAAAIDDAVATATSKRVHISALAPARDSEADTSIALLVEDPVSSPVYDPEHPREGERPPTPLRRHSSLTSPFIANAVGGVGAGEKHVIISALAPRSREDEGDWAAEPETASSPVYKRDSHREGERPPTPPRRHSIGSPYVPGVNMPLSSSAAASAAENADGTSACSSTASSCHHEKHVMISAMAPQLAEGGVVAALGMASADVGGESPAYNPVHHREGERPPTPPRRASSFGTSHEKHTDQHVYFSALAPAEAPVVVPAVTEPASSPAFNAAHPRPGERPPTPPNACHLATPLLIDSDSGSSSQPGSTKEDPHHSHVHFDAHSPKRVPPSRADVEAVAAASPAFDAVSAGGRPPTPPHAVHTVRAASFDGHRPDLPNLRSSGMSEMRAPQSPSPASSGTLILGSSITTPSGAVVDSSQQQQQQQQRRVVGSMSSSAIADVSPVTFRPKTPEPPQSPLQLPPSNDRPPLEHVADRLVDAVVSPSTHVPVVALRSSSSTQQEQSAISPVVSPAVPVLIPEDNSAADDRQEEVVLSEHAHEYAHGQHYVDRVKHRPMSARADHPRHAADPTSPMFAASSAGGGGGAVHYTPRPPAAGSSAGAPPVRSAGSLTSSLQRQQRPASALVSSPTAAAACAGSAARPGDIIIGAGAAAAAASGGGATTRPVSAPTSRRGVASHGDSSPPSRQEFALHLSPSTYHSMPGRALGSAVDENYMRDEYYALADPDSGYVPKAKFCELHRKMSADFGMPVESSQRQLERTLRQYNRGGRDVLTYDEFALLCLKVLAKW